MSANFHPLVYIIDYILGIIMWTLIGKSCNEYFSKRRLSIFFYESVRKIYKSIIKLFKPITPSFIIQPLVPLYVAWFFFMIRFYLMPYFRIFSYGNVIISFESEISRQIYQFFNSIKF